MFVDVLGQREHFGFVQVADKAQAAIGVAIQRAVAHRQFGFVAGGQQQIAESVGVLHENGAAHARLQVFERQADERLRKRVEKLPGVLVHQIGNRVREQGDAEVLAQGA
ncbi:hypothetical protein SDC9_148936 [bioreactor metagenome]|uniref:Uncharacterized protein n=1 Tax=bioreactor metagenome TaxID=1076179 RepID=A0A645EI93_9ZZZZ